MKHTIKGGLAVLALAFSAFGASALTAGEFDFHVVMDTSPLVGSASAPFYLDLQMNQGASPSSNSVLVNNFSFTNGAATGSTTVFSGAATGDMSSGISMTDSDTNPFNEVIQGFTNSTTQISFDVHLSQNSGGATPDGFIMTIADKSTAPIVTTAPDTVSLLSLAVAGTNTLMDIQTFAGVAPLNVTITSVPEPTTTAALIGGAAVLVAGLIRRRRNAVAVAAPAAVAA